MKTILGFTLLLGGCTDPDAAIRILQQQGYTNIETHGYGWFQCGKGDTFATTFTATNQNSVQINGTECKGFLKGS